MYPRPRPKLSGSSPPNTLSSFPRLPPPSLVQIASPASSCQVSEEMTNFQSLSIIQDVLRDMARSQTSRPRKSSTSKNGNLRVKTEYRGEKSCIEMERPVIFNQLKEHLCSKYGRQLNIYYTLSSNELVVPIRNQQELDRAIQLLEKSPSQRSLRLLLSQHQSDSGLSHSCEDYSSSETSFRPDESGTFSVVTSRIIEVFYVNKL